MQSLEFSKIEECVACGSNKLLNALDLGLQPLANDFREPANSDLLTYPLQLLICKTCYHGQLSISVMPDVLFRNYFYASGTTNTLLEYFLNFKRLIIENHGKSGKLLEIASNDGTFLKTFLGTKWSCIGVDPAINLLSQSIANGVITIPDYFNEKIAEIFENQFDVIVGMNVFAHVAKPIEILQHIERSLKPDGTAYIQTSQADMFLNNQFDTIYHEHISFFNVNSMQALLNRTNLKLKQVTIVPIHGNSYLWEIGKATNSNLISLRLEEEKNAGLYTEDYYNGFADRANEISDKFCKIVDAYRSMGYKISLYGAAAKGNTFLNFAKVVPDYIFDDASLKIGKLNPAGNVKVSSPDDLPAVKEKLLHVISAWNFSDEIKTKIKIKRAGYGDLFLTYFPKIELGSLDE